MLRPHRVPLPGHPSARLSGRLLGLVTVAAVALAGCGDDADTPRAEDGAESTESTESAEGTQSTDAATEDPAAGLPDCAEVWVEGQRLPARYEGCVDGAGGVSADLRTCSIGDQLATHDDRWYAVPGRVVNRARPDLAGDQAFQDAVLACTG